MNMDILVLNEVEVGEVIELYVLQGSRLGVLYLGEEREIFFPEDGTNDLIALGVDLSDTLNSLLV